jgi:hypothetical protein
MNNEILVLLAVDPMAASIAANAQPSPRQLTTPVRLHV